MNPVVTISLNLGCLRSDFIMERFLAIDNTLFFHKVTAMDYYVISIGGNNIDTLSGSHLYSDLNLHRSIYFEREIVILCGA